MPLRKTDGSCFKLPQPERKAPQLLLQGSATGLFTPSDNLDGSLAQQGRARGLCVCRVSRQVDVAVARLLDLAAS